ncbi:MAG: PAP/fibrillin family protein [Cyanobacteriota bacterium]
MPPLPPPDEPVPSSPAAGPAAASPAPPAVASGAPSASPRSELLALLRDGGGRERIPELIEQLEQEQPADLCTDAALVEGVWELRWSSSSLPYLATARWITNLQVLAPSRGQGMNLLRLAGPLGELAAITVRAAIAVEPAPGPDQPCQRVSVRFEQGGWLGPRLAGQRLQLLRQVKQTFPAWLDITVVDQELRLCRGNAGTVFALLRRPELSVEAMLG